MEVNLVITYDISEDSIEVNLVIRFVYFHAVPDIIPDKVLMTDSFQIRKIVVCDSRRSKVLKFIWS